MNLDEMLQQYAAMTIELAPALDAMKDLERRIKAHVLETGETGNGDAVAVTIRNGYERTTWDGKALAGYAAAHPEIEQFCKVVLVQRQMDTGPQKKENFTIEAPPQFPANIAGVVGELPPVFFSVL